MARQINGFVGTFATSTELTTKFPPLEYIGCSANVGTAAPYVKYWCDGQAWAGLPAQQIQALVSGAGNAAAALKGGALSLRGAQGWTKLNLGAGITSTDGAIRGVSGAFEFRGRLLGTLTTGMTLATVPPALLVGAVARVGCVTDTGITPVTVNVDGTLVLGTVTGSPAWVALDGLAAPMDAGTVDTTVTHSGTLPVMRITTTGGVALPAPALDTYVTGTIEIDGGTTGYESLSLRAVEVSGHGNSTFLAPKKPMKVKLTSAAPVLGMPSGRHWRALANYYDQTLMRNAWAFEAMRRIYSPWTPRGVMCEVYLNGEYQGVYQMTESVRADANRLPVTLPSASASGLDATGAYMLEINTRYIAEGEPGFTTATSSVPIQFDDPSPPAAGQITYITDWINNFDAVLMGSSWLDPAIGYAQYVDMQSWADWWLVSELTRNQDSVFNASVKLYKTRDTASTPGRLYLGPLWDSDISLAQGWNNAASEPRDFQTTSSGWYTRAAVWLNRMMRDPAFVAVAQARWAVLYAALTGADGVVAWGRRQSQMLSAAAHADARRWALAGDAGPRWEQAMKWLQRRMAWLQVRADRMTVINLVTNPRASVGTTGYAYYAGAGGVAALSAAAGNPLGGNSVRLTWSTASSGVGGSRFDMTTIVPGKVYTALAMVRCSKSVALGMRLGQATSGGAAVGTEKYASSVVVAANTLTALPLLVSDPMEPTAGIARWNVFNTVGTWAIGDWLEICGLMVVEGVATSLTYADPDTHPTFGWVWDGTAFASTSRGWPI